MSYNLIIFFGGLHELLKSHESQQEAMAGRLRGYVGENYDFQAKIEG